MNKIIKEIKKLKQTDKIIVCIRHSNRNQIPDGKFGDDILLNEVGIANAYKFGNELKEYMISNVYTSPIERCVQTAKNISEGSKQNINIVETKVLGNPGLHVTDADAAGKEILERGFFPMYHDYINDKQPIGTQNKIILKQQVLEYFKKTVSDKGISIYVTHDSFIAFFENAYSGKIYSEKKWINYLEGFILTF